MLLSFHFVLLLKIIEINLNRVDEKVTNLFKENPMLKVESFEIAGTNKGFEFLHGHTNARLLHLATDHSLLDNCCNFLSSLCKHLIHILRHWVSLPKILRG